MSKFIKLKHKYQDLVTSSLMRNKDILIESFIEYYGEEYRSLIEKRYDEIVFIYYIDWHLLKKAIDNFISTVENSGKYTDFILFYENKDEPLTIFDRLTLKNNSNLPKNFIGSTNINVIHELDTRSKLELCLKKSSPTYFDFINDNNKYRIIAFQILNLPEDMIINIINYALTNKLTSDNLLEKLLYEKSTKEIAKIFKRRGGNLTSFCYGIPFASTNSDNYYLVNDFYKYYKKEIKKSIISESKDKLVQKIGEQNYYKLIQLIKDNYSEDSVEIELNKEACEKTLAKLINNMINPIRANNPYIIRDHLHSLKNSD